MAETILYFGWLRTSFIEDVDLSALEDMLAGKMLKPILTEIDDFLSETGMGASYFGRKATGNSELVTRLRAGRRIWPETEQKVRTFIAIQRSRASRETTSTEAA